MITIQEISYEKRKKIAARPKGDFVLYLTEKGDDQPGYVTGRKSKIHQFGYHYRDGWQLTDDINEALRFTTAFEASGMAQELTDDPLGARVFTRKERGGDPLDFLVGDIVYLASDLERKTPLTVTEVRHRNRIIDTMEMETGEDLAIVTWFRDSKDLAAAEIPLKCISL